MEKIGDRLKGAFRRFWPEQKERSLEYLAFERFLLLSESYVQSGPVAQQVQKTYTQIFDLASQGEVVFSVQPLMLPDHRWLETMKN